MLFTAVHCHEADNQSINQSTSQSQRIAKGQNELKPKYMIKIRFKKTFDAEHNAKFQDMKRAIKRLGLTPACSVFIRDGTKFKFEFEHFQQI